MEGDVAVRVSHTTMNYKDGLALTGKAPVMRKWPLIPGIDFAGSVTPPSHPEFRAGDAVVLNGWGVGETHHGGYPQLARVKGDWLVKLPSALHARTSDGDRYCWLHRDARACWRSRPRRQTRQRCRAGDGRGRRRRQRRHSRASPSSVTT